jgi:hypothetical protein
MKPLKTKYAAAAFVLAALLPAAAQADGVEVLHEGFDNVGNLSGWLQFNLSNPTGTGWFQGNSGIFDAQCGAPESYIGANYLGAANGIGNVDNWLITPQLTLSGLTELSFYTRNSNEGGNDKLQVLFLTGDGPATAAPLLATVGGNGDYATDWLRFTAQTDFTGTGRFAFRYLGDANDLTYIGLDTVNVLTAVPEPSLYLMLGLGLGVLALLRRRLPN